MTMGVAAITKPWLLCGLMIASSIAFGDDAAMQQPIASTESGKYQGQLVEGVNTFLGIPYAASTAGDNRWKKPLPLPVHEDTRVSDSLGPACLQSRATRVTSEDCLSLNIWSPELDGAKRPVLVWIHGGGLRAGSNDIQGQVLADSSTYDNSVVVVAINYRLGPLGFFSHRALKGKHANFGLLDMVAALEWVQTNIASFGGNPDNVTIAGVSAGGMAVNLLLTSPLSEGLFHKAIAQSGYGTWPLAHTRHSKRPPALGLDGAVLDRAERRSAELIEHVTDLRQTRKTLYSLSGLQLMNALDGFQLPYVDGQSLKAEPGIRFAQNKQHNVPFITGAVSNEGTVIGGVGLPVEEFARGFGSDAKRVRKLYKEDFSRDSNAGWTRVFGDTRYLLSAKVLGEAMALNQSDVWLYYMDFVPDAFKTKWLGTPHGMDGWLLFNGHTSEDPVTKEFANNLRQYWLNFAYTGNPNGAADNSLPQWLAYTQKTKNWQLLAPSTRAEQNLLGAKLELLSRRYAIRTASALNRR